NERGVLSTAVAVVFQYGSQGFIGLLLTALLMNTVMPDLFPSFGLFVPLGYALGPGQAFAIGGAWEAFGFVGAGSVGLTFAALGFLIACFVGVFLINYGIRKGWASRALTEAALIEEKAVRAVRLTGIVPADHERPVGARLTTYSDAVDSMTVNAGFVAAVYTLSYIVLRLISYGLGFFGELGVDLATNLWGINFVFSMLMAVLVKKLVYATGWERVLDSGSLARISGTAVDVMVAAAVGAISIVVVAAYWLPILIIGGLTGLIVVVTVPWMCSRLFVSYRFQRTVIIFGAMTGTLPTGLALLRVIDPDFSTPVAGDYVYSAAFVFAAMIPMILAMNLPAYSVTRGEPFLFWLGVIIIGSYMVVSGVVYLIIARRRAFRDAGSLWLARKGE
ncbi:MAG: sodium:glutamate symporter, partial [Spirochaetota bacterium]